EVLLWDTCSGRLLARLEGFSDRDVELVRFDTRGDHVWELASAHQQPWRLACWDVNTDPFYPRLTWSRPHEETRPHRTDDGPIGAIEGQGPGFRLRDLAEAVRLGWTGVIESHHGQAAAASPDGRMLAVGAGKWNVLWDVKADRELARYANQIKEGLI